MTWVKLDDCFTDNRKVDRLSDRAFRLYVAGLCFCGRNLTDGYLSAKDVRVVAASVSATKRHISELTDAELWLTLPGGTVRYNDYLKYNEDAETVKKRRDELSEKRREAGRKGADARWSPDSKNGKQGGKTGWQDANGKRYGSASYGPLHSSESQKLLHMNPENLLREMP